MHKDLPARPNVEHLKSQAKDLLEAHRRGDEEANNRIAESLPHAREPFALHDAQSVVAREYGFESFAKLCAHVESLAVRTLMAGHPNAPLPDSVIQELHRAASSKAKPPPITRAASFPLLPLRGTLITMGSVVPINIGRPSSIAAAQAARNADGLLVVFSQRDAANEAPAESDLHPVGCIVQLLATHTMYLVLRATQWVKLEAIERNAPYYVASVTPFEVGLGDAAEVTRLERLLRAKVRPLAATLPGERILAMLDAMTAAELADATIANLPCSVADKARYASEPTVAARLRFALALVP